MMKPLVVGVLLIGSLQLVLCANSANLGGSNSDGDGGIMSWWHSNPTKKAAIAVNSEGGLTDVSEKETDIEDDRAKGFAHANAYVREHHDGDQPSAALSEVGNKHAKKSSKQGSIEPPAIGAASAFPQPSGAFDPEDEEARVGTDRLNPCQRFMYKEFVKRHKIVSLADFGTGNGLLPKYLKENKKKEGIEFLKDVHCYDGNPAIEKLSSGVCKQLDLGEFNEKLPKVELAFSNEVGEHIPKPHEKAFIDNLTGHSTKFVLLSWGHPGQTGNGHVNEQSAEYLESELKKRGYHKWKKETDKVRLDLHNKEACGTPWSTYDNMNVYAKDPEEGPPPY